MCFHSLKKKMELESKKLKKMMIFDVLVPEMKNELFVFAVKRTAVT